MADVTATFWHTSPEYHPLLDQFAANDTLLLSSMSALTDICLGCAMTVAGRGMSKVLHC